MRFLFLILPLLIESRCCVVGAAAPKGVSGTLHSDTVWSASMNPIQLESNVLVPKGVALTVLEGASVNFDEGAQLLVEGSLLIRGASGQEVLFNAAGQEPSNPEVSLLGTAGILSASFCHFKGSRLESREGARCDLTDCLFDSTSSLPTLRTDRAGETRLVRCRFHSTEQPILAVRSRIDLEDCDFEGMTQEGIVLDALLQPSVLRLILPSRIIAGKTLTFRADLVDKKGDLCWWMWDGVGSVSAFRHGTDDPIALSNAEFRILNGIGSLTTSLNQPGLVDLIISAGGVSATRTILVLNSNSPTLNLNGMLSPDHLDWGPDDGVIHLSGDTIVPATGNLIIRAGALVMLDHETELEVLGTIRVEGTYHEPVYFFATNPLLSWAQIRHRNSTYEMMYDYAIFTGGGVGPKETGEEHTFDGPILRFRPFTIGGGKGARINHCVFADNEGKGIFSHSGDRFVISDCLFTRCEFGAELHGDTIQIEDSYFLDLNTGNNDQDALYLWRSAEEHSVRRCIIAYNGDDGIDTWESDVEVTDSLIYGSYDKNISLFLNNANITNCLFFGGQYGIQPRERPNGIAMITQCTIADHSTAGVRVINAPTDIDRSILWGNAQSLASYPEPATVGIENSILSVPGVPIEGKGNRFVDPLFRNPLKKDYRLSPNSPGIQSGPQGENLGWLGFPSADSLLPSRPSVIRNCRFQGGAGIGILLRHGADCVIEDCRFSDLPDSGVKTEGKNWLEVQSSLFLDCGEGIALEGDAKGILDHLTLVECATTGIQISASEVEFTSSIIWNCGPGITSDAESKATVSFSNIGPGGGALPPGYRNLNADPMFVAPADEDFHLQPNSPCRRTGQDRTDMGSFQSGLIEPRSSWLLR